MAVFDGSKQGDLVLPRNHCANCISKMSDIICQSELAEPEPSPCSCAKCRLSELKVCKGCRLVKYCSESCQREHWLSGHRTMCKLLSGRTETDGVSHQPGRCQSCTAEARGDNCVTIRQRRVILNFYFQLFGCEYRDDGDSIWTCPFQLGECTGQFVGWIDETLSGMRTLLRLAWRDESRSEANLREKDYWKLFDKIEDRLHYLRACYWVLATISSDKNKDVMDHVFFILAYHVLLGKDPESSMLTAISEVNKLAKSCYWVTFVDLAGLFIQKLRVRKFKILNFESIPEPKREKLGYNELIRFSTDFDLPEICDDGIPIFLFATVPPKGLCFGCQKDLSGEKAQFQDQFPSGTLKFGFSNQEIFVRNPKRPIVYNRKRYFVFSCGDKKECIYKTIRGQIEVNNAEASLFCNFLSHTRLCDGCLRYSMKTHKCGRCKSVVYCSQQCLEGDWPNHKFSCAVFAETQSSLRGSRRLTDTSKRIHEKLAICLIGRMDPYVYDSMKWIGMESTFDEPSDERLLFNADFREFLEARGSQRDIKSGNN